MGGRAGLQLCDHVICKGCVCLGYLEGGMVQALP